MFNIHIEKVNIFIFFKSIRLKNRRYIAAIPQTHLLEPTQNEETSVDV